MIGPLITLILGDPGMTERILAAHVDDGTGRCTRCVAHDRPAARHPCVLRNHALHARVVRESCADGRA
jgi:hypothetical protein